MAAKFLIKRTSIAGRAPNTTSLSTGEIALNMTDGIMYGSNGSIIFEIGANTTSLAVASDSFTANSSAVNSAVATTVSNTLTVTGALTVGDYTLPSTDGANGYVLVTDGNGTVAWAEQTGSSSSNTENVSAFTVQELTYDITSNTVVITGADNSNNVLDYEAGTEDVFLNGVKLVAGSDYFQTNTTAITLAANAVANDVVEVQTTTASGPADTLDLRNTVGVASGNTSDITIDTYAWATYRTAKYLVQANTSDSFAASEAIVIHDGATAYMTEYGELASNGTLYTLSADIVGSDVRLIATPARSGTTFKFKRISIKV